MESITADDWHEIKQRGQEVIVNASKVRYGLPKTIDDALRRAQLDARAHNAAQFIIIKIKP